MRTSFSAVLFDIDGTLVDSTGAVERSWRTWALAQQIDPERILAVSHGRRSEDTIADFVPAAAAAAATAELARLELSDLDDITALPGAAELLAALPKRSWAAVTSGPRPLMIARLDAAGLPCPDVLVTAEAVSAGKPDPQGYLLAAEALGVDIRDCLIVEDAPAGVSAGRNAGATVFAVATTHGADALGEADAVIGSLADVRASAASGPIEIQLLESR